MEGENPTLSHTTFHEIQRTEKLQIWWVCILRFYFCLNKKLFLENCTIKYENMVANKSTLNRHYALM